MLINKLLKKYREIALLAIKDRTSNYNELSYTLKEDRDFILQAIKTNCYIFKKLLDELKEDREIALEAVKGCFSHYDILPKILMNDQSFINELIKHNYLIFDSISKEMKNSALIKKTMDVARHNDSKLLNTNLFKAFTYNSPSDSKMILNKMKHYISSTKQDILFINSAALKIQLGLIEYFLGEELYKKLSDEDKIFNVDNSITDEVKELIKDAIIHEPLHDKHNYYQNLIQENGSNWRERMHNELSDERLFVQNNI